MKKLSALVLLVAFLGLVNLGTAQTTECEQKIEELEEEMQSKLSTANSTEEEMRITNEYNQKIEQLEAECRESAENESFQEGTREYEVPEEQREEEIPEEEINESRIERPPEVKGETEMNLDLPPSIPDECRKEANSVQRRYSEKIENASKEERKEIIDEMDREIEKILDKCSKRGGGGEEIPPLENANISAESKKMIRKKACGPLKQKIKEKNQKISKLQQRISELEKELGQNSRAAEEPKTEQNPEEQAENEGREPRNDVQTPPAEKSDGAENPEPNTRESQGGGQSSGERENSRNRVQGQENESGGNRGPDGNSADDSNEGFVSGIVNSIF